MFYGTLDGFIKARDSDTGKLLWKFKLPSGVIGHPMTYTHKGVQYVAIYYGVGGWPGVGLVFDLNDPTAGLGSVGRLQATPALHPDGRRRDGVLARRQGSLRRPERGRIRLRRLIVPSPAAA